jgi:S-(hydroxymethyl)glutathione dehydrogenase/alcohol dehydrogenase
LREPGSGSGYTVEEFDLEAPRAGEVLVRLAAAGLCHTDDHLDQGDLQLAFKPVVGGHEGAGVVEQVGPGVSALQVGDHVVLTPPACGRCADCLDGHGSTCELGPRTMEGPNVSDGTYRRWLDGDLPVGSFVQLGTFAERSVVSLASCVKIPRHIPLARAALVGCGVVTGWGAATYTGRTSPGDAVVVIGIGGVGINAIQGARMAGASTILAVDPVEVKRAQAPPFGATHTAASIEEAAALLAEITSGGMAQVAILAVGVATGDIVDRAVSLTGKRGVTVVTSVRPPEQRNVPLDLNEMVTMERQIRGCLLGSVHQPTDIPRLLEHCEAGDLLLDEQVTRTYTLDQINDGYGDLRAGRLLRGQILFEGAGA